MTCQISNPSPPQPGHDPPHGQPPVSLFPPPPPQMDSRSGPLTADMNNYRELNQSARTHPCLPPQPTLGCSICSICWGEGQDRMQAVHTREAQYTSPPPVQVSLQECVQSRDVCKSYRAQGVRHIYLLPILKWPGQEIHAGHGVICATHVWCHPSPHPATPHLNLSCLAGSTVAVPLQLCLPC